MRKKWNIIADKTIPYLQGILESYVNIKYLESYEFTRENLKEADILIIRSIDKCKREILAGSNIKLITTATIGFDHIDTEFCDFTGILWKNAPGSNASSVAQYVLSSLIYTSLLKGENLKEKTIGIVGVGNVGKQVEKVCKAYGMNILRNDPPRAEKEGDKDFVSLKTISQEADIITFHTPLIKSGHFKTFHLADEKFFNSLKRKPWIINSSRGSVHNTDALIRAKENGQISELIVDCWENEPTINSKLLELTTVATPHIAGFSADGKANATRACLLNIEEFLEIKIPEIRNISPEKALSPIINLNTFENYRIENAILHTFNPVDIDIKLRVNSLYFEFLRTTYNHPREFRAYTILNGTQKENSILENIGFLVNL